MNIALVTDSTADIPADLAQAYQIHVIPNLLVIGSQSFEDGKTLSRQEFYEQLPQMKTQPTTATASAGVYQHLYEHLIQQGAQTILSLHAAGKLSGVLNAANSAAQSFGQQVYVLDSEQLSLGLGFQVLAAAEAVQRGASVAEVLAVIADTRRRVRLIAMFDTLEYVRRSGRVSWARARLGELLQIKPFIELRAGQVHSLGESRTRSKGLRRLKQFLDGVGPLERLAILHTNAEAEATRFLADLHLTLPYPPFLVNVTTVIGSHVGPNGVGFTAVIQ